MMQRIAAAMALGALCLLAWGAAVAGELEIDKDGGGIRIIQKERPRQAPAPESREESPSDQGQSPEGDSRQPDSQKAEPAENLEKNPEYVEALNKLTERFNAGMQRLQQEYNRLVQDYNSRVMSLRRQVATIEQAMQQADADRNLSLYKELQARRTSQIERVNSLEDQLRQAQNNFLRRERELRASYEREKSNLEKEYRDGKGKGRRGN